MYIYYIKNKDKALVQNSTGNYSFFDNTNTLNDILNSKNKLEILDKKLEEISIIKNIEEKEMKFSYLSLLKDLEEKRIQELENRTNKVYSNQKKNVYINTTNFIEDLNNKLKLIDFYLELRYCSINKQDFNISFNKNENQSKKLKFISMCFSNIYDTNAFINSLVENDKVYNINKQKYLK